MHVVLVMCMIVMAKVNALLGGLGLAAVVVVVGHGGLRIGLPFASTQTRGQGKSRIRSQFKQHFLYFLPEPHGQGSLRPTLGWVRT